MKQIRTVINGQEHTVLAVQVNRARVDTTESLAEGSRLDPVQGAFARRHALQCGFCTPGTVIAVQDPLRRCQLA